MQDPVVMRVDAVQGEGALWRRHRQKNDADNREHDRRDQQLPVDLELRVMAIASLASNKLRPAGTAEKCPYPMRLSNCKPEMNNRAKEFAQSMLT